MSSGTGIAGAVDYHPASHAAEPVCWVCGGAFKASSHSARVMPGALAQACSAECAADPRYAADPRDAEIAQLRAALLTMIREDSRCAESDEPPCPEGRACGCREEMRLRLAEAPPR